MADAKRARAWLIRIGLVLLGVILLCTAIAGVVMRNELRSLSSIRKVGDSGLLTMTYYGDYGFDDFLQVGASNDDELVAFIIGRLLRGLPIHIDIDTTGGGCSVFVTRNAAGDVIMGRNFDFPVFSAPMHLATNPDNGFASVSTVNLIHLGFGEDNLPSGLGFGSFSALGAPYVPFDGMNEKGLAIALLAVPEAEPPFYEDRVTLNGNAAIRLVLDQAETVAEAVELLSQYNIYFSVGIQLQFLIADASGSTAIVNFLDGQVKVTQTDEPFQIATNFIPYNGLNIGEGACEFERYDRARYAIERNGGILGETQAIDLLAEIGVVNDEGESTLRWSVVYNLTTLEGVIFANRSTDNLYHFSIAHG